MDPNKNCNDRVTKEKCQDKDDDDDPASWTKEDWACFLQMDSSSSISELLMKIKALKSQFAATSDTDCNRILETGESSLTALENLPPNVSSDQSQAGELFTHMFSGTPTTNQIVATADGAQIQKRNVTPKTDITDTAQGVRNPISRDTFKTNIIINSLYRTNPLATPTSNYTLDINIKMVVAVRLASIKIPKSWYPFDYSFGNNYFGVTETGISDISCVDIVPAYYDEAALISAINASMTAKGILAQLTYNSLNNKVTIDNTAGGATDLSFVFYDKNSTACDSSGCINYTSLLNNNLGYFLGFRNFTSAGAPIHNLQNLIIQVLAGQTFTAQAQLNLNTKITAIISMDDYNHNLFSEKVKLIEGKNTTIQMPSYYDRFDLSCNPATKSRTIIANNPRNKTQAQIYTLQQILNHNVDTNSVTSKKITNTLGMFSLTANEYTHRTFTKDECSQKLYMGPVDLERVKITIQDVNGYILNMNYADWEFGLEVEQLYKY
jgi:hypothetical protein